MLIFERDLNVNDFVKIEFMRSVVTVFDDLVLPWFVCSKALLKYLLSVVGGVVRRNTSSSVVLVRLIGSLMCSTSVGLTLFDGLDAVTEF